jgi:hypothetical protein
MRGIRLARDIIAMNNKQSLDPSVLDLELLAHVAGGTGGAPGPLPPPGGKGQKPKPPTSAEKQCVAKIAVGAGLGAFVGPEGAVVGALGGAADCIISNGF